MVAEADWVTKYEDRVARFQAKSTHFLAQSLSLDPLLLVSSLSQPLDPHLCDIGIMAHRIERNPDWKVSLNMAAAAGALTHVRSAPQALARTGGSVSRRARARACVTPCANLTPKRFLQRVG